MHAFLSNHVQLLFFQSGQVEEGILVDDKDGVLESTEYFHPLETSTTQCKVVLDYKDENKNQRSITSEACIIQSESKCGANCIA